MSLRQERRVHPHLNLAIAAARDRQQLDDIPHLTRVLDISRGDLGDALTVHVIHLDARAEGDGGEDGDLVLRVNSLYVCGWVRLGIA